MSHIRSSLFLSTLLAALLITGCGGKSLEPPYDARTLATGAYQPTPGSGFDRGTYAPGSALLSWHPPRRRTDGSKLRGLAGYRVYFGKDANPVRYVVEITNPGQTSQFIDNLDRGTWYFSITAYDRKGVESRKSPRVSKTIG